PETGFSFEEEAAPTPVIVLRNDSSRTAEGFRVAELDVLMPLTTGEAAARATLQHVIDSVSTADTLAAAVRVTGFVLGAVDSATASADVLPAIRATWGPIDSAGFIGAQRRSRYRTNFVILRPFDTPAPEGRDR
ncbi:MAG: hypothetical protein OEW06_14675, partial [Gemmatimonadota bacterium]|nr:hypothetical protein [Gemmatimonadota bacterium]